MQDIQTLIVRKFSRWAADPTTLSRSI